MKKQKTDSDRMQRFSHETIEKAADAIFWVDNRGRIYRVNEAACKLTGYTSEELVNNITVPDLDPNFPVERFQKIFKTSNPIKSETFESVMQKRDGSQVPLEVVMNYIDFDGERYSCSFIRDISERKRQENALKNALDEVRKLKGRLEEENIYLREELKIEHNFGEIIGHSPALKSVLSQIERVAPTDATVLILGETGTGKELVARAIHGLSHRNERPLVKVNCAALPVNLIESELFGHEKGAFTGALNRKTGRFELADNGTIFLDEIGDLPLELQTKLLRVLQEGEFERLGNPITIHVDTRTIAATNREIESQVQTGDFREDLYYRLNVFPIHVPALRERREDIPLLVRYFIEKFSKKTGKEIQSIPEKVMKQLQDYHWPGNIRELENIVERALILSPGTRFEIGDWFKNQMDPLKTSSISSLEEAERQHIIDALETTSWRVSGEKGAATLLKINPQTLVSRMKKLGIKGRP